MKNCYVVCCNQEFFSIIENSGSEHSVVVFKRYTDKCFFSFVGVLQSRTFGSAGRDEG